MKAEVASPQMSFLNSQICGSGFSSLGSSQMKRTYLRWLSSTTIWTYILRMSNEMRCLYRLFLSANCAMRKTGTGVCSILVLRLSSTLVVALALDVKR